jgi:hypothetical protein
MGLHNNQNRKKVNEEFKMANQQIDEEDDGFSINNQTSPFVENRNCKHVVDIGAMKFRGDSQSDSIISRCLNESTPRSSFPTIKITDLEMKEGWLLKRSFTLPNFIGWQRRY